MRRLFDIDSKDYEACTRTFVRNSARALIIKGGLIAMVYSQKYDYYKFPGGGIEPGERNEDAVIRETREEAGLQVIPESVREYGFVHRVQRTLSDENERFIQDNFYYLCDVSEEDCAQELDGYEAEEGFTPVFVSPREAIRVNREKDHGPKDQRSLEREARVLELLLEEGYFAK